MIKYFKYQEEYTEKYGPNTIVLYQKGTFFEIYEYDPEKSNEKSVWPNHRIGLASEISPILNMALTSINKKKPHNLSNPYMVGFPCIVYEKHRDVLLANDYTLIKVEQKKDGNNITRFVSEILSPATNLENINSLPVENSIVSLYLEVQKTDDKFENYLLTAGISSIDVTTGISAVSEIYSKTHDQVYGLQEIYRYLTYKQPKEIMINLIYKKDLSEEYKNFIWKILELDKISIVIFNMNKPEKDYTNTDYQSRFLTKLFGSPDIGNTTNNPMILEQLDLERLYWGTISYIYLLQYCYEHNQRLIEKIQKPITNYLDEDHHLILTHNAQTQIDLCPPRLTIPSKRSNNNRRKIDSLFSVINNTSTALGKRFLNHMLANPITDINQLNRYYDTTEDLINNKHLLAQITSYLKTLPDLERYQRKLCLRLVKPTEFVTLFKSYISIVSLCDILVKSTTNVSNLLFQSISEFNQCLTYVLSKYKLDALNATVWDPVNQTIAIYKKEKAQFLENILCPSIDPTSDKYIEEINQCNSKINEIVNHLNTHLTSTRGKRIIYTSNGNIKDFSRGLGLFTTPHKAKILKNSAVDLTICGNLQFTNINKEVMITSDVISSTCQTLISIKEKLHKYLYKYYNQTLIYLSDNFTFYNDINKFISVLDFVKSNAITAIENKYFKPKIEQKPSFIQISDMRHPIIEKIIDFEYVTNDVYLDGNGMILYGINSAGKSSLTKAVGLNLILAQSGLYTAGKTVFSPYKKIITRLSSEDNLIQGDSSFVVEMKELRTILRNADRSSLILGDELCRGTESISGTCLTVSTIQTLIEKEASFIFSSHMHHITSMPQIKEISSDKLQICHLLVKYCSETNNLIYDRKLKPGPGDSIYGLEVAMSLNLEQNFMNKAFKIRNWVLSNTDKFLSTKKSKYNSKVYIDRCTICGENDQTKLQTHHLKEQHMADKNGFIGYTYKNISGNLIEICEKCHLNIHQNGLCLNTQETSNGLLVTTSD